MGEVSTQNAQRRFEVLCISFSADLTRFVYWLCRDRTLAEDVVQETLLRAWRSLDSLREDAAARSWLLTIARRELARVFERKRIGTVGLQFAEELPAADALVGDHYDVQVVRRAIFGLDLTYREPLVLQMLFGYTAEEIAGHLQLSVTAVLTRLYRARQLLIAQLRADNVAPRSVDAL
jgi:RNA polymerase sigma-70 factor, ECF subfamily